MTDGIAEKQKDSIELEYDLNEPPQKVWRAISIPEFRESWLPQAELAEPVAALITPGREVAYRMRDNKPPFLESVVTFRITPNETGGTSLRIIHELADQRFLRMMSVSANSNASTCRLAA